MTPSRVQVLDEGRVGQAEVGAPKLLRHAGVAGGRALDVDLVDHRVGDRHLGPVVVAPVVVGVDEDRTHRGRRAVEGAGLVRVAGHVGQQPGVVDHRAGDGPGVGVEQQLLRVVELALAAVVDAVGPEPVELAGLDEGQVAMPHVAVHLRQLDARLGALLVEQAELNAFGVTGVHGDVRAHAVEVGAEGVRAARPELHARHPFG